MTKQLTVEEVKADNPHFKDVPYRLYEIPLTPDKWAQERGYTKERDYKDPVTGYQAMYGYHEPSGEWHMFQN